MDLDLITNGMSIKKTLNSFLTSKISWVVLGYIGNKTLAVIETGDDSLEDMFEEFHGSKIMYGFASVVDPNSKLKKNVFIFWQGSGASQSLKTASVQHCNVIRELCKPIHVTITARDEQDLDLKDIMLKVAAASGSNYSFHNEDKHIFETQPSIKSESNTANMIRQERQKELASLSSLKKAEVPSPPKASTNGTRNDPVKGVKPVVNSQATFQKPTSNYVKINPEKELQSLNVNQKTTFESAARVKSENNTAERAREERQKELSQLMNRTYNDDGYQQVGTNYTKINPIAEIQKLRKQSQSQEVESVQNSTNANIGKFDAKNEITRLRRESNTSEAQDNFNPPPVASSYKKIDPLSEIQQLRKANQSSESDTCVSPSSNYKKINPAEEIKSLKSQNAFSFQETTTTTSSYKKVNPMEEIMAARKSSTTPMVIEETKPIQRTDSRNDSRTARMSFENIHKKEDSHKRRSIEHKTVSPNAFQASNPTVVEAKKEEKIKNTYNPGKNINIVNDRTEITKAPVENKIEEKAESQFNFQTKISQEKIHPIEIGPPSPAVSNAVKSANSAVAVYEYQANDSDEISFDVDDLITEIEQIDDGWWIGCNKEGIKGMFPSNYVKMCKNNDERVSTDADDSRLTTNTVATEAANATTSSIESHDESHDSLRSTDLPLTVIAQYAYSAQDGDEISFEEGDKIFNVNKIDDGWWEGETRDGSRGMFPSNYVTI